MFTKLDFVLTGTLWTVRSAPNLNGIMVGNVPLPDSVVHEPIMSLTKRWHTDSSENSYIFLKELVEKRESVVYISTR